MRTNSYSPTSVSIALLLHILKWSHNERTLTTIVFIVLTEDPLRLTATIIIIDYIYIPYTIQAIRSKE